MSAVFVISDNILTPLGASTAENFSQLENTVSGIELHDKKALAEEPFYASLFERQTKFIEDTAGQYTRFEQMLIVSVKEALSQIARDFKNDKTILIISTTKGNISLLETSIQTPYLQKRIAMTTSANLVAEYFGFVNQPIIVSNACISGIMAIITGTRLIQSGKYENAIVVGADEITRFVLSGFQSFQAISSGPCKPFDVNRDGITLGEGAATVILSSQKNASEDVQVLGGAISNDANHISAPSRTGHELGDAIKKALTLSDIASAKIGFISAHGTATTYNDEMEAKAIAYAGLANVPVNSLKGYFGHTLGAAGLIESIIAMQSLKKGLLIPTKGLNEVGVSEPINVIKDFILGEFNYCLKTASGFGGCNAAIIFGKQID